MKFTDHDLGQQNAGSAVLVALRGTEANVRLLDAHNFANYRAGRQHQYIGGHYKQSRVRLGIPRADHWHVAVDLGGAGGQVQSSVQVIPV